MSARPANGHRPLNLIIGLAAIGATAAAAAMAVPAEAVRTG